ncbi:MAG TPA: hypothetical protein VEU55_04335 [Gemmatimonadales bacterium]|nr:hypothetical protein [Gemmatimonadales bacterium]
MRRLAVGLATLGALALGARPAPGQQVTVGPQFVLASYREVSSGLAYQGAGFGGTVSGQWRRYRAEAVVTRVTLNPSGGSPGLQSFTVTQVDAWVAYDIAAYASVEAGLTHRSPSPAFGAQAVGAVRLGARAFSELGPGATMSFRADYLAAPQFSGGGHASLSLDLGLGLDVRLAGRLHGSAAYAFQHIDRKVSPGGTPEIDAPIQQSTARVGVALGF